MGIYGNLCEFDSYYWPIDYPFGMFLIKLSKDVILQSRKCSRFLKKIFPVKNSRMGEMLTFQDLLTSD